MLLLFLSSLCFLGYMAYISHKYGLPRSLSATYYTRFGSFFLVPLLALLCVAFGSVGLVRGEETTKWLSFVSAVALALVAATPDSRHAFLGRIHLGAALVATVGSQALVAVHYPVALGAWLLFAPLVLLRRSSAVLWAELLCFTTLFVTFIKIHLLACL